jgi:hypothetical protein
MRWACVRALGDLSGRSKSIASCPVATAALETALRAFVAEILALVAAFSAAVRVRAIITFKKVAIDGIRVKKIRKEQLDVAQIATVECVGLQKGSRTLGS